MQDLIFEWNGNKVIQNRFRIDIIDIDTREVVSSSRPGSGGVLMTLDNATKIAVTLLMRREPKFVATIYSKPLFPEQIGEFRPIRGVKLGAEKDRFSVIDLEI